MQKKNIFFSFYLTKADIVDVKVLEVDLNKKRIALTMRLDEKEPV